MELIQRLNLKEQILHLISAKKDERVMKLRSRVNLYVSKGGASKRLLIQSDSWAAIAAVVKAGKKGNGRTKELRQAVNLIAKRCRNDKTAVCLG